MFSRASADEDIRADACAPFGFAFGESSLRNASRFFGASTRLNILRLDMRLSVERLSGPCARTG